MTAAARNRYSTGAMIFHWLIALGVLANWRIAEAAEHATREQAGLWMGTHKAIGITILVLTLARLAWRLTHPVPPLPGAAWERILARTVHVIFYVLLIGLPIGGWLASSYAGRGIDMFGLFDWPLLPLGQNREAAGSIMDLHAAGGKFLIILVGLHILGALKHTFISKDGGLLRMLPFGRAPG